MTFGMPFPYCCLKYDTKYNQFYYFLFIPKICICFLLLKLNSLYIQNLEISFHSYFWTLNQNVCWFIILRLPCTHHLSTTAYLLTFASYLIQIFYKIFSLPETLNNIYMINDFKNVSCNFLSHINFVGFVVVSCLLQDRKIHKIILAVYTEWICGKGNF